MPRQLRMEYPGASRSFGNPVSHLGSGKQERAAGVETFEESRQPPDARKRSGQIALFEIEG